MKKIMIIAAHPDDEVLGCGGTISKYKKNGAQIKVVFIGEGSSCRFDKIDSQEALNAVRDRNSCATKALNFLGVQEVSFHDLPCGRFDQVPILQINKIIEFEIKKYRPDTVFTHSCKDANNDHRIVYNATLMATRPGSACSVPRLFAFEVLSSSEWNFSSPFAPNFFEELVDDDVEKKWRALEFYSTEIKKYPFPRSAEGVRALAMLRGMQAGFEYAESFCLVRELKT